MWLLCAWAVALAVVDLRARRIPNRLLLIVGVPTWALAAVGLPGLLGVPPLSAVLGAALGAGVFLPGYLLRSVGAGDVKFAAVAGGALGLSAAAQWLLIGGLLLGIGALASRAFPAPGRSPASGLLRQTESVGAGLPAMAPIMPPPMSPTMPPTMSSSLPASRRVDTPPAGASARLPVAAWMMPAFVWVLLT